MPLGTCGWWRPGYDVSTRVVFGDACDTRGLFLPAIVDSRDSSSRLYVMGIGDALLENEKSHVSAVSEALSLSLYNLYRKAGCSVTNCQAFGILIRSYKGVRSRKISQGPEDARRRFGYSPLLCSSPSPWSVSLSLSLSLSLRRSKTPKFS
jgi:hypothetical protein